MKELNINEDVLSRIKQVILTGEGRHDPIKNSGGAVKTRVEFEDRGKSGGLRTIYFECVTYDTCYLIGLFAKKNKENLTDKEVQMIREYVKTLKEEIKNER